MLLDNDNINLQQITKLLDNSPKDEDRHHMRTCILFIQRTFYAQIIEKYKYFKTEEE